VCTLIVLHRCVPRAPLVIAANRDENLDRPSEGPKLLATADGPVLAPRDTRAGGTWLGLNRTGVFAGVTNRHCEDPDPTRRSRGWLVMDALRHGSAAEAAAECARMPRSAYNPFNLVIADRERAFLVTYEEGAKASELAPGPHVIGNIDPHGPRSQKLAALDRRVGHAAVLGAERVPSALATICRSHGGNGDVLGDACVHAGAYGTRSSTLLCLADDPDGGVFRYADGAPCETEYDDFTPLLHDLRREPRYEGGATATRSAS
jgi:uncharacterized protein with NRDE domain